MAVCRQLKADSTGGGDTNVSSTIFYEDIYHNFTNYKFKEDWVVGKEKDDPRRKAGKQTNEYFKPYREHVLKYPHIT